MKLLASKFVDPSKMGASGSDLERDKYDHFLNRHPYAIPLLLSSEGEIIREAHGFLLEKEMFSRSIYKTKTSETYSECLLSWFDYCSKNKIDWRSASHRVLVTYRNSMKSSNGNRSKSLSASTINLRMTVLLEFMKYYLSSLSKDEVDGASTLSRVQKLSAVKLSLRKNASNPVALSQVECKKIKNRLRSSHQLIFTWGLLTGLRIGTVLAIRLDALSALGTEARGTFLEVFTKGGKKQNVFIPKQLIEKTTRYVEVERKLQILRKKRKVSDYDSGSLFLNHNAVPVTRECYYAAYKRACRFLNISSHPHQARTTFATFVEKALRAYGKVNSLDHIKIVQGLLGHASAETTMHYIESLQVNDTEVLAILEVNAHKMLASHG
jgi:integrase